MTKISVIVPIYNAALYVEKCVESILNQSFKDFELLLVDDRGVDNSMEIVAQVLARYPDASARIITQPFNKGVSSARNVGTLAATGQYIYYIDSDDFMAPYALELLINASGSEGADVVYGDHYNVAYPGEVVTSEHRIDEPRMVAEQLPSPMLWVDYWPVVIPSPWNILIRRSMLAEHKIDFTEGVVYEDVLWNLKILAAAKDVVYMREPTYYYRLQNESIMRGAIKPRNIESALVFCRQAIEFIDSLSADMDSHRVAYLTRAVKVRKINIIKQILGVKDVKVSQKIAYIRRVNSCGGGLVAYDRMGLPQFTKALSYALGMPAAIGYLYAMAIDKLPRKR